jgi:hypothetical protein
MTSNEQYLSRKEFSAMQEFMSKHEHAKIFILKYVGTGIGTATGIICSECQEDENVTDYEDW